MSYFAPSLPVLNNLRLLRDLGYAKCALGGQGPELVYPARQGLYVLGVAIAGGTCDTAVGAAR